LSREDVGLIFRLVGYRHGTGAKIKNTHESTRYWTELLICNTVRDGSKLMEPLKRFLGWWQDITVQPNGWPSPMARSPLNLSLTTIC